VLDWHCWLFNNLFFAEYPLPIFHFFFSSRRRHTRSKRDWSSDVCSSDLENIDVAPGTQATSIFSFFTPCCSNVDRAPLNNLLVINSLNRPTTIPIFKSVPISEPIYVLLMFATS